MPQVYEVCNGSYRCLACRTNRSSYATFQMPNTL